MNKRILATAVIVLLSVTSPAEAEDRFFDSNGVRIRFVDEGSGQPIVLVHGILGSVENNWVETGVLPKLSHHFRVIALDLRGHGKSGKPHDRNLYGQQVVLDVVRLMDHLD